MSASPRLLAGRYEVGELIGRGGMAEVHLGHDTRLGRQVAIKMLRSDLARDQSFIARFRREAQSAAGLNHASIVAIFDSGEDHFTEAGGASMDVPYIVMEYVEGVTLRQVLTDKGRLEPKEAARITEGVLDALAYSHRNGIVHRDIKPANVMVGTDGEIKVMDFGIARAIADTAATMTQTQAVIGTAQYLSPEQAQGQHVDERSDLYSTGCMLFELLTGRAPFVGDSPVSIAYQHVGEVAPRPSTLVAQVPEALDDVVAHSLVKDRAGRYQRAEDFRADLQNYRLGRPVSDAAAGSAVAAATAVLTRPGSMAAEPTEVYAAQSTPRVTDNTAGLPAIGHDPDDEPEKRRTGAYVLMAVVIAALIGGAIFGLNKFLGSTATPTPVLVTVPQVVDLQEDVARSTLTAAKLRVQVNQVTDAKPAGTVVDQSADPGSKVPENTIVNISVSTGPEMIVIPNVSGKSVDEARALLTDAKLVVAEQTRPINDSSVEAGKVDSTIPGEGDSVQAGSTITLQVSSGKVTVPDVVGKSASEATQLLADAGLTAKTELVQSTAKEGNVLSQSPTGGLLERNATVTIRIAMPAPPTTTVTTTPTPTPTESTATTPTPTETATTPIPTTPQTPPAR